MGAVDAAGPDGGQGDAQLVNADAAVVLRHPLAMVLVLVTVAGAMDARDYQSFGVFTANQAGNMVLLWVKLPEQPAVALLSLGSMIGAALGIAFVVFVRRWRRWFSGAEGSRTLLFLVAFILAVTSVLGGQLFASVGGTPIQDLRLWSLAWAAAAASVMLSAFALGALATVFVAAGAFKAGVIAITGPFVDGTRYLAASFLYKDPEFRTKWKYFLAFPAAWSVGAMIVGLTPLSRASITLLGVAVVIAVASFARRIRS